MEKIEQLSAFKEKIVEIANETAMELDGTIASIKRLADKSALLIAVWQDANEPDGVGMAIIKGLPLGRPRLSV